MILDKSYTNTWISALVVLATVLFSVNTLAEIYQCVDGNNKTVYQDIECDASFTTSKKIELEEPVLVPAPNTRLHIHNIVRNPSFEDEMQEWTVPEFSWWDAELGKSKTGAALIQAKKPPENKYIYETAIEQCIAIDNLSEYGFAVDVLLDGIPTNEYSAKANLYWYKSEDCTTYGSFAEFLRPKVNSEWQHLSREKIKPALGTKAAKIHLIQNGRNSNGGKVVWDNVQLYPMRTSATPSRLRTLHHDLDKLSRKESIVFNGRFDSDVQGWRGSDLTWSNDAGNGAGLGRLESTGSGIGTHVGTQCVKLGQQRKYTLHAKFLKDSRSTQSGGGRFRLHWNDKDDCTGRSGAVWKHADIEDKLGWQELWIENIEAPAEARAANIELIQSVKGEGFFAGYWDDIFMVISE